LDASVLTRIIKTYILKRQGFYSCRISSFEKFCI